MAFKYPNKINVAQRVIIRGTNQQVDTGLLWVPPSITLPGIGSEFVAPPAPTTWRNGIEIGRFELENGAAANNLGIGFRFANRHWEAGLDVGGTYTKAANLQAVTAVASVGATSGDGIQIYSEYPFNWVSANFSTALSYATGADVDTTVISYTDVNGDWATLFTGATPTGILGPPEGTGTSALYPRAIPIGTGEACIGFQTPVDWGKTDAVLSTNGPIGMYGLRILWTGAGAVTTGVITGLEIGEMLFTENVGADGGLYENESSSFSHPVADGVVAFFEIADNGNRVYVECRTSS